MRKIFSLMILLSLGVILTVTGCEKKAATSEEAIQHTQTLSTVQEKENYLVAQANSFLQGQKYEEALQSAQYILASVNQDSEQAKNIIENAQKQLQEMAQKKLGEVQADANKAVDNMKNKLGNLGK